MTSMQGIYVKDEQEFAVVKDNQGFAGGFPLNQDLWVAIETSNQYNNKWVQAGNRAGGNCSTLSHYHASDANSCFCVKVNN